MKRGRGDPRLASSGVYMISHPLPVYWGTTDLCFVINLSYELFGLPPKRYSLRGGCRCALALPIVTGRGRTLQSRCYSMYAVGLAVPPLLLRVPKTRCMPNVWHLPLNPNLCTACACLSVEAVRDECGRRWGALRIISAAPNPLPS